jgi:hypothetical protein
MSYVRWATKQGLFEPLQRKQITLDKDEITMDQLREVLVYDLEELEYLHNTGNVECLQESFSWRSTPQGHDYWSMRREGDEDMTEEDWLFVERLFNLHFSR